MNKKPRCKDCRFFEISQVFNSREKRYVPSSYMGICRRKPPPYPDVKYTEDWCGEFRVNDKVAQQQISRMLESYRPLKTVETEETKVEPVKFGIYR